MLVRASTNLQLVSVRTSCKKVFLLAAVSVPSHVELWPRMWKRVGAWCPVLAHCASRMCSRRWQTVISALSTAALRDDCHINIIYCHIDSVTSTLPTVTSTLPTVTSTLSTVTSTLSHVPCHIAQLPGPP